MTASRLDDTRVFQCFKVGRHVSMGGTATEWGEADLERVCSNYHYQEPAPLVLGHPQDNGPAYGEVKELFRKKGGLYAVARCSQTLLDLVHRKHYKHVSSSFKQAANGWSLRHIGFLGALPPAVKGMAPLQFGEGRKPCIEPAGTLCFTTDTGLTESALEIEAGFSAPPGWQVNPASMRVYSLARRIQAGCPSMNFAEAAGFAERLVHL